MPGKLTNFSPGPEVSQVEHVLDASTQVNLMLTSLILTLLRWYICRRQNNPPPPLANKGGKNSLIS